MAEYRNKNRERDNEIKYEIVKRGGVLSGPNDQGWSLEVNLVAWNDRAPKIDIRSWDEDHKKMSRGITLTEDEAKNLTAILEGRYRSRDQNRFPRDDMEI